MLVQNNNRANLPQSQTVIATVQTKDDQRDASLTQKQAFTSLQVNNCQPLRTKQQPNHQQLQQQASTLLTTSSTIPCGGPATQNGQKGHINNAAVACGAKKTGRRLAASKENNNFVEGCGNQRPKGSSNADTTSLYKEGSLVAKHMRKKSTSSKPITPNKQKNPTVVSSKQQKTVIPSRQLKQSWSQPCPCSPDTNRSFLMKDQGGQNYNCMKCGAMAFRINNDETQPIFAYKLQEDRSKVQAPPQRMLIQLRESSVSQRDDLRTFVPENDQFDVRILQIRDTMLELICEVGDCLKQSQITIHLAVEYMDRFILLRNHFTEVSDDDSDGEFANRIFEGHSLDAVALTCLLLASKFQEIDDNIPLIEEFCKGLNLVRDSLDSGFLQSQRERPRMTQNRAYPGFHAVQRAELYLLGVLCWDLNTVTPLNFIQNHLYQGVIFSNDCPVSQESCGLDDHKLLQKVKRHVDYFTQQAIKQEFMLSKKYLDQTIAAAIIYAARQASKVFVKSWNREAFLHMFGVSSISEEVKECYSILYATYDSSLNSNRGQKMSQRQTFVVDISLPSKASKSQVLETEGCKEDDGNTTVTTDSKHDHTKKSASEEEASNSENSIVSESQKKLSQKEGFSLEAEHSNNSLSNEEDPIISAAALQTTTSVEKDKKVSQATTSKTKSRKTSASKFINPQIITSNKMVIAKSQSTQKTGKKNLPSRKASVSTFDQQTSAKSQIKLKSCYVRHSEPDKSMSPVKEFRNRDGPIAIFQQRDSRAAQKSQQSKGQSRDRSTSSTSLIRLQPTMIKTGDNKDMLEDKQAATHIFLQAHPIMSDESLVKRNTLGLVTQKSTTPRTVLDFTKQSRNRHNSKAGGLMNLRSSGTEVDKNTQESSSSQLKTLLQKQRNSVYNDEEKKENHRRSLSKSVIFTRKTELNTQQDYSEFPEVAVVEVDLLSKTPLNPDESLLDNQVVSQNLKPQPPRSISALSSIKAIVQAEFGHTTRNKDQNFIRRNINYVSQLDQKAKEKKSLQASHSFILENNNSNNISNDLRAKVANVTSSDVPEQPLGDEDKSLCLQKCTGLMPKTKQNNGEPKSTKKSNLLTTSKAVTKSQYFSNQSNYQQTPLGPVEQKSPIQLSTYLEKAELPQPSATPAYSSNTTPKQIQVYRPSKLFSKKQSVVTAATSAVTTTAVEPTVTECSVGPKVEQPRISNPTKSALYKFKSTTTPVQHQRSNNKSALQQSRNQLQLLRSIVKQTEESCDIIAVERPSVSTGACDVGVVVPPRTMRSRPYDSSNVTISDNSSFGHVQRPQNNHLRPTKSSMLRAKSSLGLASSAVSTEINGITGKLSEQVQVHVPEQQQQIAKFSIWAGTKVTTNQSGATVSPQFGVAARTRKSMTRCGMVVPQRERESGAAGSGNLGRQSKNGGTFNRVQIELVGAGTDEVPHWAGTALSTAATTSKHQPSQASSRFGSRKPSQNMTSKLNSKHVHPKQETTSTTTGGKAKITENSKIQIKGASIGGMR